MHKTCRGVLALLTAGNAPPGWTKYTAASALIGGSPALSLSLAARLPTPSPDAAIHRTLPGVSGCSALAAAASQPLGVAAPVRATFTPPDATDPEMAHRTPPQ